MFLSNQLLMLPVLRLGIEHGIEMDFIRDILGRLGEDATSLLVELSAHPDPAVRRRVIGPLAESGGDEAFNILEARLSDADESVTDLAVAALQSMGQAPGASRLPLAACVGIRSLCTDSKAPRRDFSGGWGTNEGCIL